MASESQFLPAKVVSPNVGQYVTRDRLFSLLERGSKSPLTWISGPGGSGKTIAVASYLQSIGVKPYWYQVDARDNDPATIFHYLSLLANSRHGHGVKLPVPTPEYLANLALFSKNYFEQLYRHFTKSFVLVFDNYQDSPEQKKLNTILTSAIQELPPGCRIICISREKQPCELSSFLVKKQILLIDEEYLRFNTDEIIALSELNTGNRIELDKAEALINKTMGWAAGLVLLLDSPELIHLSQNKLLAKENVIFDYFNSEFFDIWDDEMRHFLATTSLLPRITIESAEIISGSKFALQLLNTLIRKNFFIVPYMADKSSFQYHPLFHEFLRNKSVEVLTRKEHENAQRIAVKHLLNNNQISYAVTILCNLEDWDSLIGIILAEAPGLERKGQYVTLSQWLSYVPEAIKLKNPYLLLWQCICDIPLTKNNVLTSLLNIFEQFHEINDKDSMALTLGVAAESLVTYWGDMSVKNKIISLYEKTLPDNYICKDPLIEARVALGMTVMIQISSIANPSYPRWISRVKSCFSKIEDVNIKISLASRLLYYHSIITGKKNECEKLIEQISCIIETQTQISISSLFWWRFFTCIYYWYAHDFERMEITARKIYSRAKELGAYYGTGMVHHFLIAAYSRTGRTKEAQELLDKSLSIVDMKTLMTKATYHFISGINYFNNGQYDNAVEHGILSSYASEEAGNESIRYFHATQLCRSYFMAGRHKDAIELINSIKNFNSRCKSIPLKFSLLVIEIAGLLRSNSTINLTEQELNAGIHRIFSIFNENFVGYAPGWSKRDMSFLCAIALERNILTDKVLSCIELHKLVPPDDYHTPANWPASCQINIFERFDVIVNGKSIITGKGNSKPFQLLKTIIALGCYDIPEEKITDNLWPDADGDTAASSFSTTVQRLRKLLGKHELIHINQRTISLDRKNIRMDVDEFTRICNLISTTNSYPAKIANHLINEFSLEPFANCNEPYFNRYREKLNSTLHKALKRLILLSETEEKWLEAINIYEKCLELWPNHEVFYQGLMKLYLKLGKHSEAIMVFDRCRNSLKSRYNIEVSPETLKLRNSVKSP